MPSVSFRRLMLLASLSAFSAACEQSSPGRDAPTSTPLAAKSAAAEPGRITIERSESGVLFGRIGYVAISDSLIWVADITGDPFLHVYSLGGGRYLRSLGVKGSGPGEFQDVGAMLPANDGTGDVIVFDRIASRLTRMSLPPTDIQGLLTGSSVVYTRSLPITPRIRTLAAHSSGFVGWAVEDSNAVLLLLDSTGRIVRLGKTELLGRPDQRRQERWSVSASHHYCISPASPTFALAYRHAGRIAMYDSNAVLTGFAQVPYPEARSGLLADADPGAERGRWPQYASCVATASGFVALHSGLGQPLPASDSLSDSLPGELHVFSWSGELKRRLRLPQRIERIALAADGHSLLGTTEDGTRLVWMRVQEGALK